jgi:hypothetical protein
MSSARCGFQLPNKRPTRSNAAGSSLAPEAPSQAAADPFAAKADSQIESSFVLPRGEESRERPAHPLGPLWHGPIR